MAKVVGESRRLGSGAWMKDFGGREHILPIPAKLDPTQFYDGSAVLVKANGALASGKNEKQSVVKTGGPAGGTFTLTFGGQTTTPIAYNAIASVVEAALAALSTIGVGNVKVVTVPLGWLVEFTGSLRRTNVAAMTEDHTGLTGGTSPTIAIVTEQGGAADPAALTVDALTAEVPAGTTLQFPLGVEAITSTLAAAGDVSIALAFLSGDIADNAEARYSRFPVKYIPSGMLVGRTYAEAASNSAFGLATDSDDEIYFIPFEVSDALVENDCELYRHGSMVATNFLPQQIQDLLAANAALLAKVRAAYVCITAEA